jgi:hypothetical protein
MVQETVKNIRRGREASESTASAEQSASASEQLASQAQELRAMVEQFQLFEAEAPREVGPPEGQEQPGWISDMRPGAE